MTSKIIIGPFRQIITMRNLPKYGIIKDHQLEIVEMGGIIINDGIIQEILNSDLFSSMINEKSAEIQYLEIKQPLVLTPGFIDAHTHICFAGNRADEYAMKLEGQSYIEIANKGGGILNTVNATRAASQEQLTQLTLQRAKKMAETGITTCEVKSGYGLTIESELKILRAIKQCENEKGIPDLISTCLAAHVKPPEFKTHEEYLNEITSNLLPQIKKEELAERVDIFIEEGAFEGKSAENYLKIAKELGFQITVHADQFSVNGSKLAAEIGAISADHLEASSNFELEALKAKNVIATVLPGASLGLGIGFAPARKILDLGLELVISSDWNPGSAPMGDLLVQAAIIGAYEKLSMAETFAAITFRAADALNLVDRGKLDKGMRADMCAFPCENFSEILYRQGVLKPEYVWKNGKLIVS